MFEKASRYYNFIDALADAVEIFRLCDLILRLYSQCAESAEMDERYLKGLSTYGCVAVHHPCCLNCCSLRDSEALFSQWTWQHRYREDGLVLEQDSLLPLIASYALTRVAAGGCGPNTPTPSTSQLEDVLVLASQLGFALRDSGHSQLTLCCSASVRHLSQGVGNNPNLHFSSPSTLYLT